MELSKQEFNNLRSFINDAIGLALEDDKEYLVRQRLEPVAKTYGCRSFSDFYLRLLDASNHSFRNDTIAAITTNGQSNRRESTSPTRRPPLERATI